jgi:hypothetical protein
VNPLLRRGLGAALALALAGGTAALSRAPYRIRPGDEAMIRLSWSARPERLETCRTPSADELARLPAHMRQQVVCEGTSARYRLRVMLEGSPVVDEVIRGGGLRHDRPIHLLRELATPPGGHRLEVRFERMDSLPAAETEAEDSLEAEDSTQALPTDRGRREIEERRRRREEAVPAQLVFDTLVQLAPRQVLLVTYDAGARRLAPVTPW